MANYPTKFGHAHLKVRDLTRSLDFYTRHFDLKIVEIIGDHYAFLSGGDLHHEIALQSVGPNAPAAPVAGVGLYHVAFEVPDERSFALAYQSLINACVAVGPVDHGISWAMYFDDPDGNGLEIYLDRRKAAGGRELWHGRNTPLHSETILAATSDSVP